MPLNSNFYKNPNAIHDLGLTCHEQAVLSYLARCCDHNDNCFPSQATIAAKAGMSIAKAKLVLNVLLNVRGYISWRKTNRSNNYKVHFDRIQEDGENIRKAKMFGSYAMATQPSAVEEWNDLPKAEPDEAAPRPNQKMSTADDFFNDLKPNNQGKQYE